MADGSANDTRTWVIVVWRVGAVALNDESSFELYGNSERGKHQFANGSGGTPAGFYPERGG